MHAPNSEPCQGGERTCMPNIGNGSPWQLQPGKGLRGVPSRRVRTKSAALEEKISSQLPPVPHSIQTHMAWEIYQKDFLWMCPTCVSLGGRICKLNSLLQTWSKIGIIPNTSSGQRDRQRTAFHSVCFSSTSKKRYIVLGGVQSPSKDRDTHTHIYIYIHNYTHTLTSQQGEAVSHWIQGTEAYNNLSKSSTVDLYRARFNKMLWKQS